MSELRRSREWEHWPQDRRPEDGIRKRLRELFHPTVGEDEIEQALAAQSHEIELRARELAQTVADLERREERTHELRVTVEQMLRRGSAELDERHAELSDLAGRLADREAGVAEAEEAVAARRSELGAVELHRAAVERREETLAGREKDLARREGDLRTREEAVAGLQEQAHELAGRQTELDRKATEIEALQSRVTETVELIEREQRALEEREAGVEQREAALEERERLAAELEQRKRELDTSETELRSLEQSLESDRHSVEAQRKELRQAVVAVSRELGIETASETDPSPDFVALVPGTRYRIVERDDGPPGIGDRIEIDGAGYRVVRLGASPLPDDRRRCAFLEREHAPTDVSI